MISKGSRSRGDLVLLKKEILKHKFDQKWVGPYRIVGVKTDRNNVITQSLDGKQKVKKVRHEKVKAFTGLAVLPLRPADEPVKWETYANDPNLEQEIAESSDSEK